MFDSPLAVAATDRHRRHFALTIQLFATGLGHCQFPLVKTPLVKLDCREVFVAVHIALLFLHLSPCPWLFLLYFFKWVCCLLFLSLSFFFLAFPPLSTMPGAILERNGPSTEELLALLQFFLFFFSFCLCVFLMSMCGCARRPVLCIGAVLCTQPHCFMQAGSWQT